MARWPARDEAIRRAADALRAEGYAEERPNKHKGRLLEREGKAITARVHLPGDFPFAVPEVFVDRMELPRRIPHLDASGKLCLVQPGSLLDASNPEGLVLDTLERARTVVQRGLDGANDGDFVTEFLAYWEHEASAVAWSICALEGPPRAIYAGRVPAWASSEQTTVLLADDATSAAAWAARVRRGLRNEGEGFYLPMESALMPPEFGERLHFGPFCELIERHASAANVEAARRWLQAARLPALILMSMPVPTLASPMAAFMVLLPAVSEAELGIARRGWRKGRGPSERDIALRKHRALVRGGIRRADAAYLLPRTGDAPTLLGKRVTVVGCGAVGSHLASFLAMAGVGHLALIDKEHLARQNVHRHLLGLDSVDQYKASSLATVLQPRFPHLDIAGRDADVLEVLRTAPEVLEEADLVVIAVGDETLQLRLEARLEKHARRLHVWLEPLGLAQHALLTSEPGAQGCYGCLFERDDRGALHNGASLAAPGQALDRTIAGCQDSFFPFSGMEAVRAAILGGEMTVKALKDAATVTQLVTSVGSFGQFTSAGFALSGRAQRLRSGETRVFKDLGRRECTICGMAP